MATCFKQGGITEHTNKPDTDMKIREMIQTPYAQAVPVEKILAALFASTVEHFVDHRPEWKEAVQKFNTTGDTWHMRDALRDALAANHGVEIADSLYVQACTAAYVYEYATEIVAKTKR